MAFSCNCLFWAPLSSKSTSTTPGVLTTPCCPSVKNVTFTSTLSQQRVTLRVTDLCLGWVPLVRGFNEEKGWRKFVCRVFEQDNFIQSANEAINLAISQWTSLKIKIADIFAAPLLVSPRNNVLGTTAELLHWRRVTAHIWVVLLIDWSKFSANESVIRVSVIARYLEGECWMYYYFNY